MTTRQETYLQWKLWEDRDRLILATFNQSLLKPCPFCRGECLLGAAAHGLNSPHGGVVIRCLGCEATFEFQRFRVNSKKQDGHNWFARILSTHEYFYRPDFSATLDLWNTRV